MHCYGNHQLEGRQKTANSRPTLVRCKRNCSDGQERAVLANALMRLVMALLAGHSRQEVALIVRRVVLIRVAARDDDADNLTRPVTALLPPVADLSRPLVSQSASGALHPAPPSSGATGTFVSKEKLGDLEVNYSAYPSGVVSESCTSCSDPKVISLFPWLKGYLNCWADFGGNRILRVRS